MKGNILTLTVNPVIEKIVKVGGIRPHTKLRCSAPSYNAGGGGVNVSRALKNLGIDSACIYLAGGPNGVHLEQLLEKEGIDQRIVPIKGWTRDYLAVTDTSTDLQYRFGVPGPPVEITEWEAALNKLEVALKQDDYLIASGKLSSGMPNDFYVEVAAIAHKKKARLVLDTSGEALERAATSPLYLLKPNLREFSTLMGLKSISAFQLESLSTKFLKNHDCQILVVSLGPKGAFLATATEMDLIPAPTVHQKCTIGAGDSMVAGVVARLVHGKGIIEAVQYGVACGTTATMYEGSQLCNAQDAAKLFEWVKSQQHRSKLTRHMEEN